MIIIKSHRRLSKFFAAGGILLALVLAGCSGPTHHKHLPKPLYWEGSAIWVPANSASAYAHAICNEATYTTTWPYHSAPLPSGGELLTCDNGTKGY